MSWGWAQVLLSKQTAMSVHWVRNRLSQHGCIHHCCAMQHDVSHRELHQLDTEHPL